MFKMKETAFFKAVRTFLRGNDNETIKKRQTALMFSVVGFGMFLVFINAFLFHKRMNESAASWENEPRAPSRIRMGAILSLAFWSIIVVCGRFIAYDWFDCDTSPNTFIDVISGCVDGQTRF